MALKLKAPLGVVPPLLSGELFQQDTGKQLQGSGQDHAAQKQEEGVAAQFGQEEGKEYAAQAVDRGEGGVQKTAVQKPALPGSGQGRLTQPAQKGVAEEQPQELID